MGSIAPCGSRSSRAGVTAGSVHLLSTQGGRSLCGGAPVSGELGEAVLQGGPPLVVHVVVAGGPVVLQLRDEVELCLGELVQPPAQQHEASYRTG